MGSRKSTGQARGSSAYAPEARRIIVGSVLQQPGAQLVAVLKGTLAQLGAIATGDGFDAKDTCIRNGR